MSEAETGFFYLWGLTLAGVFVVALVLEYHAYKDRLASRRADLETEE